MLEAFLHERQEPARVSAVDQTVVVSQRDVTHRTYRDRIVDHDGTFLDSPHTKNRNLRLIDQRQSVQRAKYAGISSAFLISGTMRPLSSATAIPRLMSFL